MKLYEYGRYTRIFFAGCYSKLIKGNITLRIGSASHFAMNPRHVILGYIWYEHGDYGTRFGHTPSGY